MKIFMSHVTAHQKGTLAKEEFNNQVDGTPCSADTSQPLSPPPVMIQWAQKQSGHDGRVEIRHGLSSVHVYSSHSPGYGYQLHA